jgi:hypothetical protein
MSASAEEGIPMVPPLIRPPLHRRSDRKSGSVKLGERTRQIIDQINSENIFKSDIVLSYEIIDGDQVKLALYQKGNEIALGLFSIHKKKAHIGWVGSIKEKSGNRLGSFLFLVMIKILYDMNVKSVSLDNYTDDPARAAKSIYAFMDWDISDLKSKELVAFNKLTPNEKALKVQGEMNAIFNSRSRVELRKLVERLVTKIEIKIKSDSESDIWNNISKLPQIFRECGQQGGKKRKTRRKIRRKKYKKNKTRCRKRKKFKKHYMWNTKGKRYLAKTYKQHIKGSKLGHTPKKPKRKTRKH